MAFKTDEFKGDDIVERASHKIYVNSAWVTDQVV